MSDTPLTQSLYDEHRYFANEEEATEAILGFRDLCQKLERENAKLREERSKLDAAPDWDATMREIAKLRAIIAEARAYVLASDMKGSAALYTRMIFTGS